MRNIRGPTGRKSDHNLISSDNLAIGLADPEVSAVSGSDSTESQVIGYEHGGAI